MCGIAGIVGPRADQPDQAQKARAMADALAHRGPDDAGLWQGPGALLAHRRLSILDPTPAGHQPMATRDGHYVLTYNGELYNHLALRKQLESNGVAFETRCDTEVLLHALAHWGEAALPRLEGIFAFAFYDCNARKLLLARDHFGVKPLYYRLHDHSITFASEINSLAAAGALPAELSPNAIDAYLRYLYIPEPDTIFLDVHQLAPAECITFQDGKLHRSSYWQLRWGRGDAPPTFAEATRECRAHLENAVKAQQMSDVPLGAFLSGGLDSTTIVGLLARNSPAPIKTFTIGFGDKATDELRYAQIAAKHFQTDHNEAILSPNMVTLLPDLIRQFGQPFADSSALPTWLVSRQASSAVKVALSGDGGDELFAGYSWLHRAAQVDRLRHLPAPLRNAAAAALAAFPEASPPGKANRSLRDTFLTPPSAYLRRLTCFSSEERNALYQPDFAKTITRPDRLEQYLAENEQDREGTWRLALDTRHYLRGDILTKVDRMSMANSLEVRVPMLDVQLAEFIASLPMHYKFARGISKRLLKAATADLVPPALRRQRKQGFAIPIHAWFRGELAKLFHELLLAPDTRSVTYFRPEALSALLALHTSKARNIGHHLYALLVLEIWLRTRDT